MIKEYNFSSIKASIETEKMINSSIDKVSNLDFYGYDNFQDFTEMVGKKFERNQSNQSNTFDAANVKNDICGFSPNVPMYINGEPENMYNFDISEDANYHELNLYISLSWKVTSEEIEKQGQILAKFLQDKTSNKDKFKITFFGNYNSPNLLTTKKKMKDNRLELSVIVANYDDYITDNIFNTICSPCFFRLYMLNLISLSYGYDSRTLNGHPESFEEAKKSNNTLMDFMNMDTELNKITL
jgi:hypothetical protein